MRYASPDGWLTTVELRPADLALGSVQAQAQVGQLMWTGACPVSGAPWRAVPEA